MGLEPSRLVHLIDVRCADFVLIQDAWVGYSAASPVVARYELRRTRGGGLSGDAVFSTGLASRPKRVHVAMKAAIAGTFLEAIGNAELVARRYAPLQNQTDDYPRIEIVVQVPAGQVGDRSGLVTLYTESQGEFHAPWAAFVGGNVYVVAGDDVGRALIALDRPLKKGELRRMAEGRGRASVGRLHR